MGMCPPLSPETRVANKKNNELIRHIESLLEQSRQQYGFSRALSEHLYDIQPRYLFNEGIVEDIQHLEGLGMGQAAQSIGEVGENLEEDVKSSCIMMEADMRDLLPSEDDDDMTESFRKHIRKNPSIVMQINIIYSPEIKRGEYSHALKLFLKWAQMFEEHSYGGFLKPLYRHFCRFLYALPPSQFATIVDEVCIFVQLMVSVASQVYQLPTLARSIHGRLVKNENVFNIIMSFLFKRSRIKLFIIKSIRVDQQQKINLYRQKLVQLQGKGLSFFGVNKAYWLGSSSQMDGGMSQFWQEGIRPYGESVKLMSDLRKAVSPITKLKAIVGVAKSVMAQIQAYYMSMGKETPEMDPDNLSSIVMWLLVQEGSHQVWEELKVVEYFTTTNCLNCISGYYLNVFLAAMESILEL